MANNYYELKCFYDQDTKIFKKIRLKKSKSSFCSCTLFFNLFDKNKIHLMLYLYLIFKFILLAFKSSFVFVPLPGMMPLKKT